MLRVLVLVAVVCGFFSGEASAQAGLPLHRAAPHVMARGAVFTDCAGCPEMVVLQRGSFRMGNPQAEREPSFGQEGPVRRVRHPRPFAIGRTEVTRAQYAAFVAATGRAETGGCFTDPARSGTWAPSADGRWDRPGFEQGDDHPVVCVSWEDAQAYVVWLSRLTGRGYRLPSESEWEYAARAGWRGDYAWAGGAEAVCAHANGADATWRAVFPRWEAAACSDGALFTAPAAGRAANRWGLFDMFGNAAEWVADCYGNTLEGVQPDGQPTSGRACERRVFRGGAWDVGPPYLRTTARYGYSPSFRGHALGFRVVRQVH